MRILNVRFKNLNSLTGEWTLDFTHPAYTSDGIFAITGPTGAGKTTILDAICLALYGRTPRLERVNKNSNEIMSRLAGECMSEVCFETRQGRFRSYWSQHRARNKPDGELQMPRHELSNADTGEIIETRLRDVIETIIRLTGMDYERFTRSMLLAQGGFAAFLQAPANERAPILEQITGTEIYSQISIKVHEQRAEAARKLNELQTGLRGIQLLTDETKRDLESDLEAKLAREPMLTEIVDRSRQAVAWQEGIDALQKDLDQLNHNKLLFEDRLQEFKPELQKLDKARKAQGIEAVYGRVCNLRNEQNRETEELSKAQEDLPGLKNNLTDAVDAFQAANEKLKEEREIQRQNSAVLTSVRGMDIKINDRRSQMQSLQETITECIRNRQECLNQIVEQREALQQAQEKLGDIGQYLHYNAADAGLVENLTAVQQAFELVGDIERQFNQESEKLASVMINRDDLTLALEKIEPVYSEYSCQLAAAQEDYRHLSDEIRTLMGERELSEWRTQLDSWKDRRFRLEQTLQSMERMEEAQKKSDELEELYARAAIEQSRLTREIKSYEEQQKYWEKEVGHLETEVELLRRIRSLEEERAALEDNKPCPLCGAKDHPYASGNIPITSEAESALRAAKKSLKINGEQWTELQLQHAGNIKDLQGIQNDIEAQHRIRDDEDKKCGGYLGDLGINKTGSELLRQIVKRELHIADEKINQHNETVNNLEYKLKQAETSRFNLDKIKSARQDSEKSLQNIRHDLEITEVEYKNMAKQLDALDQQRNLALLKSLRLVQPYAINEISASGLKNIKDDLLMRRDRWLAMQTNQAVMQRNIADIEIVLARGQTLFNKLEEDLGGMRNEIAQLNSALEDLNRARWGLFGDKNPDEEEQHLAGLLAEEEKRLEKARYNMGQAESACRNVESQTASLAVSTGRRAVELAAAEQELYLQINQAGFMDEGDFKSACLNREERSDLIKRAESFAREETEITTLLRAKKEALENERNKMLTTQSLAELKQDLALNEANLNAVHQEIGALKNRLNGDDEQRKIQAYRVKKIELQKMECDRWNLLHEIIGSADGKKYRNFAQGLTLQMVVHYANQKLQKMTDRYLLLNDTNQPLELNVVDNYQGGEIRSAKNLSGGESFIVSLALALGLSQMASRNVRIDSFFLDEGFGTLDEDALDVALDTLAGLQQDGKLIGIISHVPAIKERIGTQIQIMPQTGGRSIIDGPGCKRTGVGNNLKQ